MHLPITGSNTDDFIAAAIVLIIGFALALKANLNWGYVLVALAMLWGVMLARQITGI